MIRIEIFTYTDAQWNAIKEQVLDDLGVDVDQIVRQITPTIGKFSITAMQSLRDRIENTVNQYHLYSALNRLGPRRDKLETLRTNAKNMHASIINALSVQFTAGRYGIVEPMLFNGVDADMLNATSNYFRKLASNLDRQIKQAGSSRDNARKTARHQCWTELLAIWCELGGKPRGDAASEFIKLASLPVMKSAVPDLASIKRWLRRRPAQWQRFALSQGTNEPQIYVSKVLSRIENIRLRGRSPNNRSDPVTSVPRDQQSPYPGSEYPAPAPTIPDDQADTSANSARGPPTTTTRELWARATVLKFFGGDKPLHQSTLYRGMTAGRYPRPILVAGNAARWVRSECEAAQQRMFDKRAEPRPKPTGRGRKRRRIT